MKENLDSTTVAQFLSLYQIAIADSDIHPDELRTLYQIGIEHGISSEEIHSLLLQPGSISSIQPDTLEEKVAYLFNLTRMAWADGVIEQEERALIGKYIKQFGFPAENATAITDYFIKKVSEGYTTQDIIAELNK
ncbi:MAG: hypothetical protein IJ680_02415 [Paludibacteraceae bacterium]|nr:hypothetical protein [Paludibacteraceae bacterium]